MYFISLELINCILINKSSKGTHHLVDGYEVIYLCCRSKLCPEFQERALERYIKWWGHSVHWTMPSGDVTERQTVKGRSRGHCAVLCGWEPCCQGFEATVANKTVLCHMAMGAVDASPLDNNWHPINWMRPRTPYVFQNLFRSRHYMICWRNYHDTAGSRYITVIMQCNLLYRVACSTVHFT